MGFKVDSSFLRFLTMGALGSRQVIAELRGYGYEPIELERYCTSNKIWATKVKRLRLPDLLCVRTGMRFEVRAKSNLMIRMSDAPNNPDRVWDAGLRDSDIIALIACSDTGSGPVPARNAEYFTVDTLRASVRDTKLGPPKSASEGAERDRTWPTTVPKRSGRVIGVSKDKIKTVMEGDGQPSRAQTFTLKGKTPYVTLGDQFNANTDIIAGAPPHKADLQTPLRETYDPLASLSSANAVDRYAAVKAILHRKDLHSRANAPLENLLQQETDNRVALEAAGTGAALGLSSGQDRIVQHLHDGEQIDLSMEAILILTEIGNAFARDCLISIASDRSLVGDERRQAAIWGLGRAGLASYVDLLPFIAGTEENVAYHAIAAFGPDTPPQVISSLIEILLEGEKSRAPAASEALRVIGSDAALSELVSTANKGADSLGWVTATIGRFPPNRVRAILQGSVLLEQLSPMLLVAEGANWLSNSEAINDLQFLLKQNL